MNKNVLFLALILSVTANDLQPANRRARTSHQSEPYNADNATRDQRAQRQSDQSTASITAEETALPNAAAPTPTSLQQLVAHPQANQEAEHPQCAICMAGEEVPLLTAEQGNSMLTCTHHEFHQTCLHRWLTECKNTCPLCRLPGRLAVNHQSINPPLAPMIPTAVINTVALRHAVNRGNLAEVQALLTAPGVDVNARDIVSWPALHTAAYHGYTAIVQALLNAPRIDVNATTDRGETALHRAAQNGHTAIVQLLCARPDITVNATSQASTALHRAAFYGRTAIVQVLLAAGADTTLRNNNGRTAADMAANDEIRQLILATQEAQ